MKILKLKSDTFIVCNVTETHYENALMLVINQNGGTLISLAYPMSKDKPVNILKSRLESEILIDNIEELLDEPNLNQIKQIYDNMISQLKTGLITNVSGYDLSNK